MRMNAHLHNVVINLPDFWFPDPEEVPHINKDVPDLYVHIIAMSSSIKIPNDADEHDRHLLVNRINDPDGLFKKVLISHGKEFLQALMNVLRLEHIKYHISKIDELGGGDHAKSDLIKARDVTIKWLVENGVDPESTLDAVFGSTDAADNADEEVKFAVTDRFYNSIKYLGKQYYLTDQQATLIRILHKDYSEGNTTGLMARQISKKWPPPDKSPEIHKLFTTRKNNKELNNTLLKKETIGRNYRYYLDI